MSLYNSATAQYLGNITRDLEVRVTKNGFAIGETNIAVNRSVKDGEKWKEETSFLPVKVLGKLAEGLADRAKKGKKAFAQGEIQEERWEKDGVKKSRVVLVASKLIVLNDDRKSRDGESESPSQGEADVAPTPF